MLFWGILWTYIIICALSKLILRIVAILFEVCHVFISFVFIFDIFFVNYINLNLQLVELKCIDVSGEMAITSKTILELLECPVCFKTPVSDKIFQCSNGHIICRFVLGVIHKWRHIKKTGIFIQPGLGPIL